MTFDRFRGTRLMPGRRAVCAVLAAATLVFAGDGRVQAAAPEIAAPALLTTGGPAASTESVRRIVAAAISGGFSAIVVPASLYDPPAAGAFDPLAEFVREAHAHGLRVHAALDIKAAALAVDFPSTRGRAVYEHPEWLMVPREIAVPLLTVDPHAPNFLGQIARWTRANTPRVAVMSFSPLSADAAAFIAAALKTFVARYELDGVAFNDLSYPGDDFDYSRRATDLFRREMRATLDADARARMDGIEAIDPFAYANEFPAEWRRFRLLKLTDLVAAMRAAVESVRPGTMLSAAVGDGDAPSLDEYVQEWMGNRLLDAVTHRTGQPDAIVFSSSLKLSAATAGGGGAP